MMQDIREHRAEEWAPVFRVDDATTGNWSQLRDSGVAQLALEEVRDASRSAMRCWRRISAVLLAPALLAGCVEVTAPERPIEINLNINIRQEVVVSLREDVRQLIERNPGVF